MARPKKETQSKTQQSSAKKEKATKEVKPKQKTSKAISPFDIIGMMFKNTGDFEKLSNLMLSKNFFMINRTCAIAYPLQAQWFNKLGISESDTIKAWRDFLLRKYGFGRTPSFVYTKGSKATATIQTAVSPLKEFTKDDLNAYCDHYLISLKDLHDMESLFPDMLVNHIKQYLKITSGAHQIEKTAAN